MTGEQLRALRDLLATFGHADLHHGDAVGADAEAHDIAVTLGWNAVSHPPINDAWRAHKVADEERAPKPYLVRNRDIVEETRPANSRFGKRRGASAIGHLVHGALCAPVRSPDLDHQTGWNCGS